MIRRVSSPACTYPDMSGQANVFFGPIWAATGCYGRIGTIFGHFE